MLRRLEARAVLAGALLATRLRPRRQVRRAMSLKLSGATVVSLGARVAALAPFFAPETWAAPPRLATGQLRQIGQEHVGGRCGPCLDLGGRWVGLGDVLAE